MFKNKNQHTKTNYFAYVIGGLLIAGLGYLAFLQTSFVSYEANTPEVKTETVEVPVLEDMLKAQIQDAIKASSTEIESQVKLAAEAKREQLEADIALTVIAEYKQESLSKLEAEYKEKALAY